MHKKLSQMIIRNTKITKFEFEYTSNVEKVKFNLDYIKFFRFSL